MYKTQTEREIEMHHLLVSNIGRALNQKEIDFIQWIAQNDFATYETLMTIFNDLIKG